MPKIVACLGPFDPRFTAWLKIHALFLNLQQKHETSRYESGAQFLDSQEAKEVALIIARMNPDTTGGAGAIEISDLLYDKALNQHIPDAPCNKRPESRIPCQRKSKPNAACALF